MISIDEYYKELMQDIHAKAGQSLNFSESVFVEYMCEFLVDQAVIEDYEPIGFRKKATGLRADAWLFSPESGCLKLLVSDFRFNDTLESLTKGDVDKAFRRTRKFFEKSLKPDFFRAMEESSSAYPVARTIWEFAGQIDQVQFYLLSNAALSKRVNTIQQETVHNRRYTFDVWDVSRLHRITSSGKAREDIVVDFSEICQDGVPCLRAFDGSSSYQSLLLALPGQVVADLYRDYGERLLEQNVRTFLQFRGSVNKGIRSTIANTPDMFFAYNNGLTATAEKIELSEDGSRLRVVTNLQIVNGGQTTASLFTAAKKHRSDLSKVYVQIKLSVIPPELIEDVVPRISQFANTQNRVNAADFFANHPFHLRIEEMSRRLWAPSSEGSLRETHWFYERARGQYANAQAHLSGAKQKGFVAKNPRQQMFTKTDLAKFENSFAMKPHIVSKGAQKNFADFASSIGAQWDAKEAEFNEVYFQNLIGKAIVFRFIDKAILRQCWYEGGYKANIVTYTLAKLAQLVAQTGKCIDFQRIWKEQAPSKALMDDLLKIAEEMNRVLQDTPETVTNVTEYCKKEYCWETVRNLPISLSHELVDELVSKKEELLLKREAIQQQREDNAIQHQAYIVNKGSERWKQLAQWNLHARILSERELSIVKIASRMPLTIPSDKQSRILVEAEKRAISEGFPG